MFYLINFEQQVHWKHVLVAILDMQGASSKGSEKSLHIRAKVEFQVMSCEPHLWMALQNI